VRSWQVRVAAGLALVGALPGATACVLGGTLLTADPGFLFVVMPIVACALVGGGLFVVVSAVALAVDLARGGRQARLRAALAGAAFAVIGLMLLGLEPLIGLPMAACGGLMVWLMCTPAAAADLGPWVTRPVAPWGSRPGRGIWAPLPAPGATQVQEAPQQGPWSPDPTTVPWLGWKGHSGPRPPWWVTWQAGLARGLPLWELLVLVPSLVVAAGVLVLILADSRAWALAMPVPLAGVMLVESRMRRRLAGR
jgi:hypothetical protein